MPATRQALIVSEEAPLATAHRCSRDGGELTIEVRIAEWLANNAERGEAM